MNISYTIFIAINRNTFLRKYLAYAVCKVRGGHSTYLNIFERILLEIKSCNEWRIYRVLYCDIDLLMISLYINCFSSFVLAPIVLSKKLATDE